MLSVTSERTDRILAIDDCREISYADVLCRTYASGIDALKYHPLWDVLVLDHDLGALKINRSETGRELTGYDVAVFLEENPQLRPNRIEVVTANPSGLDRIKASLLSSGYKTDGNERHFKLKD